MNKLKTTIITSLIISNFGIMGAKAHGREGAQLTTKPQKLGYALGIEMGKSLKKMAPKIKLESLLNGVQDGYLNRPSLLTDKEADTIKSDFRNKRLITSRIGRKNAKLIREERNKTDKERANEKPVYQLDMSMVDQSTAKKTAWSFVILYNDIMPLFTEKQLDKICQTMATPDFMPVCNVLLAKRLGYLKKDMGRNKIATFSNPQIIKENNTTYNYVLSWDETFKFDNKKRIKAHKELNIHTVRTHNTWQISSAAFSQ